MSKNADMIQYEYCGYGDKLFLFTDERIETNTVPSTLYKYEVRYDDEFDGDPVEIASSVAVNFFGTIISHEPFSEPMDIDYDKWIWYGGIASLSDYMKQTV